MHVYMIDESSFVAARNKEEALAEFGSLFAAGTAGESTISELTDGVLNSLGGKIA